MDLFQLKFNGTSTSGYNYCGFAKYDSHPLLLVCEVKFSETKSLAQIEKEIELNNINVKYNFKIHPVINNEIIDYNHTNKGNIFLSILFF